MLISKVLLFVVWWNRYFIGSQAGLCWAQMSKDGRCTGLMISNVTREECCSNGAVGFAWSKDDVAASTLFKWTIVERGGPGDCAPCHDTCDGVDCGPGKTCKISSRGKPRCVCSPNCTNVPRGAVCGSDGNSYQNECRMKKASCRQGVDIHVSYQGVCQTSSCDGVVCTDGKNCVVDQNNHPHCVSCMVDCPSPGPLEMVCGANGITYESLCQLKVATCLLGRSIGVAYDGECQGSQSCETLSCVQGKECLVTPDTGAPRCMRCDLPDCVHSELPFGTEVCGTDNRTYTSWCEMRRNACHLGIVIDTNYFGSCRAAGQYEPTSNEITGQHRLQSPRDDSQEGVTQGADWSADRDVFPFDWPEASDYSEIEEVELPPGFLLSEYIETLPEKMQYTSLEELEQLIRNS